MASLFRRIFYPRVSAREFRESLAKHNQKVEGNIRNFIATQAHQTAEALYADRGSKVRTAAFPDAGALASEIAAYKLAKIQGEGERLMEALRKTRKGRADMLHYSPLALGFAAYAAAQAKKGPLAVKHRLGSWTNVADHAYGDAKTLAFEAKRLGRFYNQFGLWRFFARNTHSVMLAGIAGRIEHTLTVPTPPKFVVELAKKIPILPRVFTWFSNRNKIRMVRNELGPASLWGLRLSRKAAFRMTSGGAGGGAPEGAGHVASAQGAGGGQGSAPSHGEQPSAGHAEPPAEEEAAEESHAH